ncbi:MAG: hypothetical protein RIR00_2645 [Pseudomonadota bacterium]
MFRRPLSPLLAALCFGLAGLAQAQVNVTTPWVRATTPAQKATGAFMQLQSPSDTALVSASSPVAGVVEIHEMAMNNNVMSMRRIPKLDLPAKISVELKPGSYHIMLMDLKQQVKAGDKVPLTLVFEDAKKQQQKLDVQAEARELTAMPASGHHHH